MNLDGDIRGKRVKSDIREEINLNEGKGWIEKQKGALVQIEEEMEVDKGSTSEMKNRQVLEAVDQNVTKNISNEGLESKNKYGGKWKIIQRTNQGKIVLRIGKIRKMR